MFVCTILCGFSVQAVVRLIAAPPLADRFYTHVLLLFAAGALVLLYAISAGMVFLSGKKASVDERSDMVVDVGYGLAFGLVFFLLGLITLVDLHSRRLATIVSALSAVLLVLFARLMLIGFW